MFHRWAAPVLVLALCAMTPKYAAGQEQQSPRGPGAGKLGRNYPNPFNPDTYIPFAVECSGNTTETHVVTMRLLNILAQPVVTPELLGPAANSTTSATSSLNGSRLSNLRLACGAYVAHWNGKVDGGGREAASGTYIVQLFVDNKYSGSLRIYYRK
jgi:hypothetical protein